jgi:hypothetical protein
MNLIVGGGPKQLAKQKSLIRALFFEVPLRFY